MKEMKRSTIDMPAELWAWLKKHAIDRGMKLREVIVAALSEYRERARGRK
jgi:macrodomain Ter protein organizer (MatP/YcbG family)